MEMQKEYIQQIAQIILRQIVASNPNVMFSWGANSFVATTFKGMPSLLFKVQGFLFKGNMVVAYNEGADLYDIYAIADNGSIVDIHTGIHCDQLQSVVDGMVERDPSWTQAEYDKRVDEYLSTPCEI